MSKDKKSNIEQIDSETFFPIDIVNNNETVSVCIKEMITNSGRRLFEKAP